ncbi:MAG: aspartate--tRNA ligase, partial [Paenibacillaceae bacterium]|nr:aspartate--tRNA ligase [Paenibacillaceae bacterium]
MKWKTIDCGVLRPQHVGQTVVLNGWVQRRRDLGGVVFVDVRDRSGIVQVVFSEVIGAHALHLAERIRNEYVIAVEGTVVLRDAETVNPHIDTGDIEVRAQHIDVLSTAKTPPFFVEDFIEVDEALRLKHRYIDLRRPEMQRTLMMRAQAARICRETLDAHGFLEIETPILTKSTPEGARDYLVPSRVQTGSFFALPQSPQLYKQLLMVGGLEKYYQIARCFRDEDLRADRQPEFTQIDIETSFVPQERLMSWIETLIVRLFSECAGVALPTPFRKLTYAEAVGTYGSDKPDLRFGLPL